MTLRTIGFCTSVVAGVSVILQVAIYRALGGAIACLVVLALFILWSTLKKNNSPKGLAGPNSAA